MDASTYCMPGILAVNSDQSVRKLKGPERPLNRQEDRALLLAGLMVVDAVVIFDEDSPLRLIERLRPEVLVKGDDYCTKQVAGAAFVRENGGTVLLASILEGYSTSATIEKLKKRD